jgi:small subunit ribosomal protein S11
MGKKTVRTTAKKRKVTVEPIGNVYVKATYNNIIVSITNSSGQIISWSSAGKMGFRGSKKNTPYAAQRAAEDCAKVAYDLGMRKATVYVKGPGSGRDAAVRVIHNSGIEVITIHDITPIPHNGCRPPKRRRV